MTNVNQARASPDGVRDTDVDRCTPTADAKQRRPLSLQSLQSLRDHLWVLQTAHDAGRLRRLGKHDPGPIFDHLARAMARSYDGFPVVVAWWLRLLGPWIKRRILAKPFKPGFILPLRVERVVWDDTVSFDEGLQSLRAQLDRFSDPATEPSQPHPIFGKMTPRDWEVYHARHAELHMSFLIVDE